MKSKEADCNYYIKIGDVFNKFGELTFKDRWINLIGNNWNQNYGQYAHVASFILNELVKNNFFDVFEVDDNQINKFSGDSSDIFNTSDNPFLDKYIVPIEQLEYVLNNKRRWVDRLPDKDGVVISKQYIKQSENGYLQVFDCDSLKIDDECEIISYFKLKELLMNRFKIKEWEVDCHIYFDSDKLMPLSGPTISGYKKIHLLKAGAEKNYTGTFYHKNKVDSYKPTHKFYSFYELLKYWRDKFKISQTEILKLLSNYIFSQDVHFELGVDLIPIINYNSMIGFKKEDVYENIFKEESAFEANLVKKIEQKHFSDLKITNQERRKENEFVDYLFNEIKNNPLCKPYPKKSNKGAKDFLSISAEHGIISERRFNYCWNEAIQKANNNQIEHNWNQAGAPHRKAIS
jgi:hypothetical protein